MMVIRLPGVLSKQNLRQSVLSGSEAPSRSVDVLKGFLAVYVGEAEKKRYVVPVSYLNQPSLQDLLRKAEEEFGFIIRWVVWPPAAQKMLSLVSLLA